MKRKRKICQTFQLAPEVNDGESGALPTSSNANNDGSQINTTNHHPDESTEIGGVTNHHESIVKSKNRGSQEVPNIPNENNSKETQRTVA
ncbi:hypothetical protein O181_030494 [Austropuccinia psidii MF-1]|uniref:Uncharacterized protein n=1 Tax=Austropuccinia psidii MF-1 TaxID=1389203 RepID=A0A9Q3H5L9_9BASI|nr:hypothetical protein [Austropuccinia psidii MF-1]